MPLPLELRTGHVAIDTDHERLFAKFRALHDAIKQKRADAEYLQKFMDDFGPMLHAHFATEEAVMREKKFPHAFAHEENHRLVARALAALCAECAKLRWGDECAQRILLYISAFKTRHIQIYDRALVRFLTALPAP